MNDIGTALLLNLVFWIVSVSALVFAGVWVVVEFFHALASRISRIRRVRESRAAPGCREDAPEAWRAPEEPEEPEEPYREAS